MKSNKRDLAHFTWNSDDKLCLHNSLIRQKACPTYDMISYILG
jgi:hypothetical protein